MRYFRNHRLPLGFLDVVSRLRIDRRCFIFVDILTGKSRLLLLVTLFPSRGIMGEEVFFQLAAVARPNAVTQDDRIEVVCAHASEYELTGDDLVIYSYNPFGYRILLGAVGRTSRNFYWIPECVDLLAHCGWLEGVAFRTDLFAGSRTSSPRAPI